MATLWETRGKNLRNPLPPNDFSRKKVLSLVLCVAVMLSVMVLGAGAAFSDQDQIENTEAVEMATALKIISGYEDGSYHPERNIKRSEMCKMICIALNGGKEPATSTKDEPTFSDIDGHWAEGYIEYCYAQGVVSGVGGGRFNPDGNVTVTQAAKMLLVALGYNADVEQFNGTNWSLYVNVKANQDGIYKDLEAIDTAAALTRDQAAQMIWNTMQAYIITKTSTIDVETGNVTEIYTKSSVSMLTKKYDGVVKYGYLSDFSYDEVKGVWTYTFNKDADTFSGNAVTGDDAIDNGTQLKSKVDYTDLFGRQVKVVYNTKDSSVVYGVNAYDSAVIASGASGELGDIDNTARTIKVNGTAYKMGDVAANIEVYNPNNTGVVNDLAALKANQLNSAFTFELIDNNGDNKIDAVMVTPMTVSQVIYVGTDTISFNNLSQKNKEHVVIYDNYAKGDWVYYTDAAYAPTCRDTFVKADLQTATVDAVKGSAVASGYSDFQLNGTWYSETTSGSYSVANAEVNDTIEYVTLGSVMFYAKVTDVAATTKNVAMVISGENTAASGTNASTVKAKLILSDGTKTTVNVAKLNGNTATYTGDAAGDVENVIGYLVTYRVNADGDYELTTVATSGTTGNLAGYKGAASGAYSSKAIGGYELADDAVVFVLTVGTQATGNASGTNDAKVYTGKEIKNAYSATTFGTTGQVLYGMENGFNYGKVAAITGGGVPAITTGSNYGYITAGAYRTVENDKTYLNVTYWTANGEATAKFESLDAPAAYPAGAIITFDNVSEGVIKNVTIVNAATGIVTGWDGVKKIQISGLGNAEVDSVDTEVIYINSKDKKGAEGGSIQIGKDTNNDDVADVANVRYVGNANSVLNLVVVDVNNEMENAPAYSMSGSQTNTAVNTAFTSGDVNIAAGNTLTITGNVDSNGNKFVGGGTLSVTGNIDNTKAITTEVTLSTANGTVTLGVPNVKIGTVSGTIGSGSLLFGAGDCNGKAVYQFTINDSRFVNGVTKVNVGGAATSGVVMNTNDDLAIRFDSAQSLTINIDFDGNAGTTNDQVSWTVTAPTF